ncbi:uncharacterized protein LOC122296636 [Carya illinoinensis]|uniref:uncharacterized protein LOC122296636 n=1 Tax=Carya illinoinensis TaxID=32201 RepID=UPI001C71B5DB|nr:uncharacterized protein LOC122296636 [Carya illinoinensis]
MVEVIPERLRKTWEIWNIRGVILVSLLLQIILFLGAPMRKRTGNRLVILLVWSSYFLAEWATSFALGLITSTQSSKHGIIKYAERTRSLYLISWGTFRESMLTEPDAGPDYVRFMQSAKQRLDEFEVVKYGYYFFKIFKLGLIVDLVSYKDLEESRIFFYGRSPEDALKVLEVELNFIYEILYTKVFVVHTPGGNLFRFLTFASVLVSLGIFFFLECKNGLDNFDIRVAYTMLLGALSLEAIALFNLILSDWTAVSLHKTNANDPFVLTIFERYLKFKRSKWCPCKDESGMKPNTNPSMQG